MVFVPFDATEDEVSALSVIRDGIPDSMEAPLRAWIGGQLIGRYSSVHNGYVVELPAVHAVQAALHLTLGAQASGDIRLEHVLGAIYAKGEQTVMRVADFLLSRLWDHDEEVRSLSQTLDWSHSKYRVDVSGDEPRLALRLKEGLAEVAQSIIDKASDAGPLLAKAWHYAFGIQPQPAEAMDFAVKAVERAVTPIICPNHPRPSLGNAIAYVREQGNWTHNLRTDGDKAPPNTTIHHMLQTLWVGQQYRHVDRNAIPPTVEQAQAHVQLAALLVGWFASETVTRGSAL
jgi:hypothetical protein